MSPVSENSKKIYFIIIKNIYLKIKYIILLINLIPGFKKNFF